MPTRFGHFELDENARSLTLRGAPQSLQPRVFDLLAYLVRNAGRVVPKDELMDALWPDLTVTEASLQRAVSLARRALAADGLERAIRSFVRHGYRFGLDPDLTEPEPEAPGGTPDVAEARRRARACDWTGAVTLFEALPPEALEPADIDVWAGAVECQGRPAAALPIHSRAVAAHLGAGDPVGAARGAVALARIEIERAAPAVAGGWLDRAESLLAEEDDDAVRASLLWMRSRLATFEGRTEEALGLASAAFDLAKRRGDQGLVALTLAYRGFYNLALGHVGAGRADQNHAAAIALSSQVDPVTGSTVYCNILWSCRTFADWERARQWSAGFESWCKASFAEPPGACDLHRAEILGAQRALPEALRSIETALRKLAVEEAWTIGEGHRIRGDIQAMIGDLAAARADYAAAAALGWDAEPGNAVLLFEEGEIDAALAALDRALGGMTWFHLQRRGHLMIHKARIAARGGRREIATALLAEIEGEPERWPQPAIRALIAETRAALAEPGDPEARRFLFLARELWTSAGMEYQAGRVRVELARSLLADGDRAGAAIELAAARMTASRIGSRRLADRAAEPDLAPAA
ncbi:winged helix-turn-helix domain-containing protein [Amaricoccus solimangrovi]|nr:winged helix-turn-helix domain-containing protein [Amaricoccus solimangrovi]